LKLYRLSTIFLSATLPELEQAYAQAIKAQAQSQACSKKKFA